MSCSLSSKRSDYAELPHGRQQTQRPPNSAMRHNPAYGIMAEFMQRRAVPVDRLEISRRRRHLHIVFGRHVEGTIAADPEIDAGRLDQCFDNRLDHAGRRQRRCNGDLHRQIVALVGVEHREAFQERNGLRFVAGVRRALLLIIRNEAVGIDHGRAALALTDMAAERERLAERQPALSRKAAFDDGTPQDQDIDATVLPAGGGILRHRQRRLRRRGAPRLDPGHPPRLQLGDDLAGDFVVEARPVLVGARMRIISGHRGSPRRGAARLSRDFQPVTANPVRTLTLAQISLHRSAEAAFWWYCREDCVRDGSPKGENPARPGFQRQPTARSRQGHALLTGGSAMSKC